MKFLRKLSGVLGKKRGDPGVPDELKRKIKALEKRMGYFFHDPSLLELALTHPSFHEHNKGKKDNPTPHNPIDTAQRNARSD